MSKMDLDDPFVSPDLRLLQTKICTTDSGVMTTELRVEISAAITPGRSTKA
jgi:hypothetical protein